MNTTTFSSRYVRPSWFVQHIFNPVVAGLTRFGLSVWGSRVLEVRGRTSGTWRTTPVNVLTFNGARYLVAPRGETQWVKNVRVAGSCRLRVGRRVETVSTIEIDDAQKPEILAAYLRRWKWEVGQFFDVVGPDSSHDELRAIAPSHPIFELSSCDVR
jgi:deazaflavin-dependent oxidoreductase (nitroreductase family)